MDWWCGEELLQGAVIRKEFAIGMPIVVSRLPYGSVSQERFVDAKSLFRDPSYRNKAYLKCLKLSFE